MPSPSPTVAAHALSLCSSVVNGGQGAHRRNPCSSSRCQSRACSCDNCGHARRRVRAQHLFVQQGEGDERQRISRQVLNSFPRNKRFSRKLARRRAMLYVPHERELPMVWLGYYQHQSCVRSVVLDLRTDHGPRFSQCVWASVFPLFAIFEPGTTTRTQQTQCGLACQRAHGYLLSFPQL